MGLLQRWDQRNQARAERDQELLGGDDWVQRLDDRTPGPRWAWAIGTVPILHWIGDVAIAVDTWRRRKGAAGTKPL